MKTQPILCAGAAYPRPWSVWADDVCLARFANEPSAARLHQLASEANARGWNGTTLEIHRNGSWQRDYATDCSKL